VAAALILYAVLNSQPLHKLLSNRLARYLGKVSFPLYLVHVPLLYTVFSSLYLWAWPASNLILLALFATFLGASLILATAGEALVDKPVLDGIHWAKERYRTRGQLQSG
jgi:peptidoglycan/LPS O-acetylase OafA/YrhL